MKEVKQLMKELRSYPDNAFVYPVKYEDLRHSTPMSPCYGLVVCNLAGQELGFIETGTNDGQVIV